MLPQPSSFPQPQTPPPPALLLSVLRLTETSHAVFLKRGSSPPVQDPRTTRAVTRPATVMDKLGRELLVTAVGSCLLLLTASEARLLLAAVRW